jgi:hypothetical protein
VNWNFTPYSGFTGMKNIWSLAGDNSSFTDGWDQVGTWNIL